MTAKKSEDISLAYKIRFYLLPQLLISLTSAANKIHDNDKVTWHHFSVTFWFGQFPYL